MTFRSLAFVSCVFLSLAVAPPGEAAQTKGKAPAGANSLDSQVSEKLSGSTCFASAAELLHKWKITRDWVVRPSDLDGGKIFASPTAETGVWVEAAFYPNHTVELQRASAEALMRTHWRKADCAPQVEAQVMRSSPANHGQAFTDQDMAKMVSGGGSYFIYLWSPHMPLSLVGFPEAQAMAAKLGLTFVALLDPEADAAAAQKAAKEKRLPASAMTRPASVELSYRGQGIHYPATLVLSHGKFSKIYPGYWTSQEILESFVRGSMQ